MAIINGIVNFFINIADFIVNAMDNPWVCYSVIAIVNTAITLFWLSPVQIKVWLVLALLCAWLVVAVSGRFLIGHCSFSAEEPVIFSIIVHVSALICIVIHAILCTVLKLDSSSAGTGYLAELLENSLVYRAVVGMLG